MGDLVNAMYSFNTAALLQTIGYVGFTVIVFAESGLLVGFFLPGDSLMVTAGLLAAQGFFNFWIILVLGCVAAVLGDSFGYAFGKNVGPRIFNRENSRLFHREHLDRARKFYEAHGTKTIVLARFMPVVRTFAPILAGAGQMRYRTFLLYNVSGGCLWAAGLIGIGFFLGTAVPDVDRYILPIIGMVVLLSVLPGIIHFLKHRMRHG